MATRFYCVCGNKWTGAPGSSDICPACGERVKSIMVFLTKKERDMAKATKKAPKGNAPSKTCPKCQTVQHARRTKCEKCGFTFPPKPKQYPPHMNMGDIRAAEAEKADRKKAQPAQPDDTPKLDTFDVIASAKQFVHACGGDFKEAVEILSQLASFWDD